MSDNRVADFGDEVLAALVIMHQMIAGGLDAGLGVIGLHLGLVLDSVHVAGLEAGGDVEGSAQGSVLLQPILVVALQPVDLAVLVSQERNSAEHFVIVLQGGDLVVLVQRILELRHQLVIRAIADTQHVHAVLLELSAELPVVRREVRGDENEILHGKLSFIFNVSFAKYCSAVTLQFPSAFCAKETGSAMQSCSIRLSKASERLLRERCP